MTGTPARPSFRAASRPAALVAAVAIGLAALAPPPARANDSSAELAAGGLVLTRNDHVRMEIEELRISRQRINVTYIFRNVSDRPQTVLMAFPLPVIDMGELGDTDVGIGDADPRNFVGFEINVNAQPVTPLVQERATLLGLDVTALLKGKGVPLNPGRKQTTDRLQALPEDAKQELQTAGLADFSNGYALPQWAYSVIFYWQQTFPPGQPVAIAHRYRPVTGATVWYPDLFSDKGPVEEFCIDPGFAKAALRKGSKAQASGAPPPSISWVSYVLTTGANWAGPIRSFRLIVEKGEPGHLVSLCRDGIVKTSPTTFTWEANDYWPEKDLKILFVE